MAPRSPVLAVASESNYLSFANLLLVRPPMVALVEADHRYARQMLISAREELQVRPGQYLEWSGARGWHGSVELLGRLGLERRVSGEMDPSLSFTELNSALNSSRERAGRGSLLQGGVVELHDLYPHLANPRVIQALSELADSFALIEAVGVVVLPEALPARHPLQSILISYQAKPTPRARYGTLVESLLKRMKIEASEEQVLPLCEALEGLSLVAADFALRLVLFEARRQPSKGTILERIQKARAKYEIVSGGEGAPSSSRGREK